MKQLKTIIGFFILCTLFVATSNAQHVGAPLVVPGNQYAFAYSNNGLPSGLTPFGLYFNETGALPGFEFRGAAGAKLLNVQSIPAGGREPGDITFGNTGSLIVGPNRYAFRYSVLSGYGLFFNAADVQYEFRTATAAPILSIEANSGDVAANGSVTGSGVTANGDWAVKGEGANVPTNGYLGVLGDTDFEGELSLDIPNDEIGVLGISTGLSITDNTGVLGYSNNIGVRGVHSGTDAWEASLGTSDYSILSNGPNRINYTRTSGGTDAWTSAHIVIDQLTSNPFPSIAMVNSSIPANGVILYSRTSNSGLNLLVPNSSNTYAPIFASAFNVTSDRTLKKEINTITKNNDEMYMNYIRNIETASYRYKSENEQTRPFAHIGVIAQTLPGELQVEVDEYGDGSQPGTKLGVSLSDMSGLMMVGIKSLDSKVTDLEAENQELKDQVRTLTEMMSRFDESLSACCLNHKGHGSLDQQIEPSANESWLGQNVPNPFDNSTTIQFYIPEKVDAAQIIVSNLEGKIVKSYELEKGYGEVKFMEGKLASGTYVYSMITNGKVVATKKMMLN